MDMPKSVRYAIRLLYLGVISYFIANALSIAGIAGARGDVQYMMVFLTLFLCAVYCLLISRVTERGKIALILVTIFGVVSILNLLTQIGEIFKGDPLVLAFSLGANFLQAVALVLLFLPMSREWFRRAQQVEDVS